MVVAAAVERGKLTLPWLDNVITASLLQALGLRVSLRQLTLFGHTSEMIPDVPASFTALTSLSFYKGKLGSGGLWLSESAALANLQVLSSLHFDVCTCRLLVRKHSHEVIREVLLQALTLCQVELECTKSTTDQLCSISALTALTLSDMNDSAFQAVLSSCPFLRRLDVAVHSQQSIAAASTLMHLQHVKVNVLSVAHSIVECTDTCLSQLPTQLTGIDISCVGRPIQGVRLPMLATFTSLVNLNLANAAIICEVSEVGSLQALRALKFVNLQGCLFGCHVKITDRSISRQRGWDQGTSHDVLRTTHSYVWAIVSVLPMSVTSLRLGHIGCLEGAIQGVCARTELQVLSIGNRASWTREWMECMVRHIANLVRLKSLRLCGLDPKVVLRGDLTLTRESRVPVMQKYMMVSRDLHKTVIALPALDSMSRRTIDKQFECIESEVSRYIRQGRQVKVRRRNP